MKFRSPYECHALLYNFDGQLCEVTIHYDIREEDEVYAVWEGIEYTRKTDVPYYEGVEAFIEGVPYKHDQEEEKYWLSDIEEAMNKHVRKISPRAS